MTHPLTYPKTHDQALADLLDPISIAQVQRLGLDLSNKRMMEVGAGGGSFARWLRRHAGDHGLVFAVDRRPRLTSGDPQLQIIINDLSRNDLPGYLDFIHAPLTLGHIPYRED